ncbi:MAG: cation:proton antiporter [Spirochaetaceae bacterium]|jgi:Kef-type K+ transport system membrane component KefB/mannitol/fructose-specific phosphotransferase system IIA component (Ntr-type)|nr:cation:proton antiporter [Spirochaetaceae bacterium]
MNITETMAELVLQIGILLFGVRLFGGAARRLGAPPVLGELLAGVALGPYALGALPLPLFPRGLFPLAEGALAVRPELYGFAMVASIILLFTSGLETDLKSFLHYSVAGSLIGTGGALLSFAAGDLTGVLLLGEGPQSPRCLFLGIVSTATSVGITARILSEKKKMDSPEGVTILAAAVFDDVLGIIMLAVVMGIAGLGEGSGGGAILGIAGKALGIWLGFTVLGLVFSRRIASFLKQFRNSQDFSILALGIALLLAGLFEKEGLAMIIGAYIAGLSLSKTDIAPVILDRLRGLYAFFVPLFFAVMGMTVNVRSVLDPPVLIFGALYTLGAVIAKMAGCGGPALLLGFNMKGALRIGAGMTPRGEVALIIAGIGLASGILDARLFGVIVVMTFASTLAAPPLFSAVLGIPGAGSRRPVKGGAESALWEFGNREIAGLVAVSLRRNLRAEGFYVQVMNAAEGISQARKDDIVLGITQGESSITVVTGGASMPFVKTAVYEVIVELHDLMRQLRESAGPEALKRELADLPGSPGKGGLLNLIRAECIEPALRGNTKEEVITELVGLLHARGKVEDRDQALRDVFAREKIMSTGMQNGIALPHAKTEGVEELQAAVGIKKEGLDFGSLDGEKSRLFILVLSPKKVSGPHTQFLAAVSSVLGSDSLREEVIGAASAEEAAALLRGSPAV